MTKILFIGKSIMLERCLNLALKRFKKIYLITEDYSIKTKYKKKVILSKLREIKKRDPFIYK